MQYQLDYFHSFLYFPSFQQWPFAFVIRICNDPIYSSGLAPPSWIGRKPHCARSLSFKASGRFAQLSPESQKEMHALCYRPASPPMDDNLQFIQTYAFHLVLVRKKGQNCHNYLGTQFNWDRNTNLLLLVCAPTRDRTGNLGMCPHGELNPQPLGVRDDAPTSGATPDRAP